MSLKKTWAVVKKESRHILRNPGTFALVTLSPLFILLTFAYSFSVNITNVAVAVVDHDRTSLSREFIAAAFSTGDLRLAYYVESTEDVEELFLGEQAKAALVVPPDFMRDVLARRPTEVQILVDGTDPNTANHCLNQLAGVAMDFAQRHGTGGSESASPIDLRIRTWFNPDFSTVVAFVPAMVAAALGMLGVAVSVALVREREIGTLETLIATPLSRLELIVGKLVPYVFTGMISVVLCALVAVYWFQVPFRGNFLLFLVLSADFLLAALSMGLLFSILFKTQQVALLVTLLIFLFPGFFLSGIFYPLVAMSPIMLMESYALPGTHYVTICRGMFLKGLGLGDLLFPTIVLFIMIVGMIALDVVAFKKRLA